MCAIRPEFKRGLTMPIEVKLNQNSGPSGATLGEFNVCNHLYETIHRVCSVTRKERGNDAFGQDTLHGSCHARDFDRGNIFVLRDV